MKILKIKEFVNNKQYCDVEQIRGKLKLGFRRMNIPDYVVEEMLTIVEE